MLYANKRGVASFVALLCDTTKPDDEKKRICYKKETKQNEKHAQISCRRRRVIETCFCDAFPVAHSMIFPISNVSNADVNVFSRLLKRHSVECLKRWCQRDNRAMKSAFVRIEWHWMNAFFIRLLCGFFSCFFFFQCATLMKMRRLVLNVKRNISNVCNWRVLKSAPNTRRQARENIVLRGAFDV